MNIIPIKYAESVLPESMIFHNGAENRFRSIDFIVYLIKTEDKLILADAGCETMPGFDMKNFMGPLNVLKNIGIYPEDITDVAITHAHHDHIECVKYFKNAVIHIQKDEYETGREYIPDSILVNKFDDRYTICPNVDIVKIGGHSKGSCVLEIKTGEKCNVIAGDECYLRECIKEKIPTGCSYDLDKSRKFIEKYCDKKYNVLLCHDK